MTQSVPPLVVVLLCVLGAGAVVTAFAAFGKSMFGSKDEPERDAYQRSSEQNSYLRRVREMNQVTIWGHARAQKREQRRQREREASDIEIRSGRSNSNVGDHSGYGQYGNGNPRVVNPNGTPVYYEEEYQGYDSPNTGYEEQHHHYQQSQYYQPPPRTYAGGRSSPYVTHQPKSGAAATYREVTRWG